MDEALKVLLGSGPLGIVVIVLWRRIQDLEKRLEEKDERHRKEIDAFHARLEGKAENFTKHLIDLSLTSQSNDVKTNEILGRLHALLETIKEAVRMSSSRKRGEL